MRTIMPFASPLPPHMSAAVDAHNHLPSPVDPQQLSRSASPQQVATHHAALPQPTQGDVPVHHLTTLDYSAPTMQTIMTSNTPAKPDHGWNEAAVPGPSIQPQRSPNKRKLDVSDSEDPHSKIRRVVRDHLTRDPSRIMPMTTVICLHAAVAQKSYGSEKRFLCPPPVVHIEGPVWGMKQQQLSMSVVSETGERSFEQKAPLDQNLTASFKFLHVTGSAKAKSFQLSLDITEPSASTSEGGDSTAAGRVWASFDSAPVTIISKPSKKTAKTRNISSCILAGGPVSLFNRINSQTVRTKYMTIDNGQLCASNVAWSSFNVDVVQSSHTGEVAPMGGPQPVTYGSEIVLTDTVVGIRTGPLVIRKVDKGRIAPDDGGPVSQMQKIALQRVNADGSRHYLSAAGPQPGTPGVIVSPTPGSANQAGSHTLLFQAPRVREEVKDGVRVITDEVDDYLCWTIVGISKFQYTFFDAFGQNTTIPDLPITPFPTLFHNPTYRTNGHIIDMTAANFFYQDPRTKEYTPLDVYLGNIGPLRRGIYQAAGPGSLTLSSYVLDPRAPPPPNQVRPHVPPVALLPHTVHNLVVVELPPMKTILEALRDDALPANGEASGQQSPRNGDPPTTQQANSAGLSISGRSLPLLFIRAYDGVGYHSGHSILCENVFQNLDLGSVGGHHAVGNSVETSEWMAAAHAVAPIGSGLNALEWTLRVL